MESKYWGTKKLIINRSNYEEALKSERLQVMENVAVLDRSFYEEPKAAEEIVNFFVNNRDSIKLQNLELNAYFSYDFDGEILAILASGLKSFTDYSDLEGDAIKPILERVGRSESRTEQLAIYVGYVSDWNEESGFPIKLDCRSIASLTGLREVSLRNNLLFPHQIRFFFDQISLMAPINLKKLDLSCSVLKTVEPDVLARSVCRLETVIFRSCVLYSYQIHAIARKILEEEDADWFCLKELDLSENNFNCDTQLLATALSRIERVHIKEFYPPAQSQLSLDLFDAINDDSKVRHLELSDVPLRPLTAKLEKIHFNDATFYPDVMMTLLGEGNKLKTLEIQNCKGFDSVALTEAFFQLDHFRIESTMGPRIAQPQIRKIFESENSFKSLEMINLNLSLIDPRTFASFVCSGVEKIDFSLCYLTSSQARAVFQKIVEGNQEGSSLNLQSLELQYRGRALERDLTDRVASLVKLKLTRTEVTGDPIKLKDEGNLAFKAGKYVTALEKFSDALELTNSDQDKAMFLRNRSAVQFKMKNFTAAIEDSTAALEFAPNDPTALIRRALAYENTKQKDLAISDIKLASTLDPNNLVINTILLRLQK